MCCGWVHSFNAPDRAVRSGIVVNCNLTSYIVIGNSKIGLFRAVNKKISFVWWVFPFENIDFWIKSIVRWEKEWIESNFGVSCQCWNVAISKWFLFSSKLKIIWEVAVIPKMHVLRHLKLVVNAKPRIFFYLIAQVGHFVALCCTNLRSFFFLGRSNVY